MHKIITHYPNNSSS